MKQPIVALQHCRAYSAGHIDPVLQQIWDAAVMPDLFGKRVLVKPNILSDAPPSKAVTTHPEVLASLLRLLLDLGAKPMVGDSPAIHTASFTGRRSGLRTVCDELGVPWADFLDGTAETAETVSGRNRIYRVSRHALECDCIVSVPKLKTHKLMFYTGAVKNLMGVIPALGKSSCHLKYRNSRSFARFLAELCSALPPVIAVADGITAMEGPGPNSGFPRTLGMLASSADCAALDVAASAGMGYDPREVPLCRAMHAGSLTLALSPGDITYPLHTPEQFAPGDFKLIDTAQRDIPLWNFIGPRILRLLSRQEGPAVMPERCIACGKCALICPNGSAAEHAAGEYRINLRTCIRCWCCHEVCPADAVAAIHPGKQH